MTLMPAVTEVAAGITFTLTMLLPPKRRKGGAQCST
jgi:hypothetical protein